MRFLFFLALAAFGAGTPQFRPALHFSPAANWTNDPNGLVYFEGEYHLFFQYNPYGDQWGHMSWGHAVSADLVHWKELPVALAEEDGVMIFTGSVVVDRANTSGFCGSGPCLVAIYTGHEAHRETQHLAYSNDRGRTWTKYCGNPVLDRQRKDFRDPHVVWHAASQRWIMTLAVPKEYKVEFYSSPNLKDWTLLSEFGGAGARGGIWECPSLNRVDGRWMLTVGLNPGHVAGGSGTQYFVGDFDGTRFVNANPPDRTLWLDYGRDNYCTIPFHGTRELTMLGWMSNWKYASKLPTSPWRGQMTLARRVQLVRTAQGPQARQTPVVPAPKRRAVLSGAAFRQALAALQPGEPFEIKAEIEAQKGVGFGFQIPAGGDESVVAGYDARAERFYVDRRKGGLHTFHPDFPSRDEAPLQLSNGTLRIQIIVDKSSIEVFAEGDHPVTFTHVFYPRDVSGKVRFYEEGGTVTSVRGTARIIQH